MCTEENNGSLPFFRLAIPGRGGIIGAIGWTGQWRADFGCADLPDPHCHNNTCPGTPDLRFTAGQENLEAFLLPGEAIRTPSIVLMHYAEAFPTDHQLGRPHCSVVG